MQFLVFIDLLFQPHVFWQYSIISKSIKYVSPLHIVTYIKESIITKLQKLYSPPRNIRLGNESPALFLKKRSFMGNLSPTCKIFIERSVLDILFAINYFMTEAIIIQKPVHRFALQINRRVSICNSLHHEIVNLLAEVNIFKNKKTFFLVSQQLNYKTDQQKCSGHNL